MLINAMDATINLCKMLTSSTYNESIDTVDQIRLDTIIEGILLCGCKPFGLQLSFISSHILSNTLT